ncbi:MAG: hypothetical protein AAB774_02345 [Patescibacteria group bacterium]|mgnify:CR=1 FL=1
MNPDETPAVGTEETPVAVPAVEGEEEAVTPEVEEDGDEVEAGAMPAEEGEKSDAAI